MEVSNETIDDLLEIIDSLIKENVQLKNQLQPFKPKRKYLYNNSLNNYINDLYSYYTDLDNLDSDDSKVQTANAIQKYLGSN